MSHGVRSPGRAQIEQKTLRQDRWWLYPAVTFTVFAAFVVYATVRAFSGHHYYSAPYLSPFYSPCLTTSCVEGSSDFGQAFSWWQLSPALMILIFPLGFRMSCYYYRKAYYRSFWLSPPACGVAEPHGKYSGETRLPLILNNIHRYFFYAAVVVALILSYDVVISFKRRERRVGPHGPRHPGAAGQRAADLGLHARLPLLPSRGRRPAAALLQAPVALPRLDAGLAS